MAEISSYPIIAPKAQDVLVGTETYVEGIAEVIGNPTRGFTIQSIADLSSTTSNTGAPFAINAIAGGASTYSSAINTILLNWTGGGGTYELTLPLASSVPYRIIRVISSSTIAPADKVHLVGQGADTVDGAAFYNLNKQYSGAQVWSSGTEWIVIQEKS